MNKVNIFLKHLSWYEDWAFEFDVIFSSSVTRHDVRQNRLWAGDFVSCIETLKVIKQLSI